LLTDRDVVSYLLQHDLINPEQIVSGQLSVTDVSRRHRNFRITYDDGPGFLLKQGIGVDKAGSVAREALVLGRLASEGSMRRYIPQLRAFDEKEHILLQELVADAQDFRHYHLRRGYFPTTLARAVGKALATLHQLRRAGEDDGTTDSKATARVPWVLSIHRPTADFCRECSGANLQLVKVIQEFPSFCEELDLLRADWRATSFIHGDIKWENILVFGASSRARQSRIKIIDWELAGSGDPSWDAGSVLSDYLALWLMSIPVMGELSSNRCLELARYPLERMAPALHAFWEAYARTMQLDDAASRERLLRAVRFAAARLVQTAFEQMQDCLQLTANMEGMLQVSWNILERPEAAATQLLGFSTEDSEL
jgi:hypothetical protein